MQGEGGQATVEWVALVLVAALVLGAAAALAGRESDPGLGEAVAKRITRAARGVGSVEAGAGPATPAPGAGAAAPAPGTPGPGAAAPPPIRRSSSPLPALPRAFGLAGTLAGIGSVAKHAWIVCLGYERWRHELENPSAPTEALPVDVAVSIVNTCFNPHDYLLEEED
jgi:hypothetical protein